MEGGQHDNQEDGGGEKEGGSDPSLLTHRDEGLIFHEQLMIH